MDLDQFGQVGGVTQLNRVCSPFECLIKIDASFPLKQKNFEVNEQRPGSSERLDLPRIPGFVSAAEC